ncbi:hypothetical protein Ddc_14907 [Ditylenchus destructor]|nr:hypothetical protein Ddc_14907 [Ditylenchus destructor]
MADARAATLRSRALSICDHLHMEHGFGHYYYQDNVTIWAPLEEELTIPQFLQDQRKTNFSKDVTSDLVGHCIRKDDDDSQWGLNFPEDNRVAIWLESYDSSDIPNFTGIFIDNQLRSESASILLQLLSSFIDVHFERIHFYLSLNYDLMSRIRSKMNSLSPGGQYELQCEYLIPNEKEQLLQAQCLQQGRHLVTKVFRKCRFNIVSDLQPPPGHWGFVEEQNWYAKSEARACKVMRVALCGRHCFDCAISFHMSSFISIFETSLLKPLIEYVMNFDPIVAGIELMAYPKRMAYPKFPKGFREEDAVFVEDNVNGGKDFYFELTNKPAGTKFIVIITFRDAGRPDGFGGSCWIVKGALTRISILFPHN